MKLSFGREDTCTSALFAVTHLRIIVFSCILCKKLYLHLIRPVTIQN
jgi:hypothetical protein